LIKEFLAQAWNKIALNGTLNWRN